MYNFTMLVGLPACGKSTLMKSVDDVQSPGSYAIISSDDHLQRYADANGKTYNEVFDEYISTATKLMWEDFETAMRDDVKNIFWDQTNLSAKKRKQILSKIPEKYFVGALVFVPPGTEKEKDQWQERLSSRPGKVIPPHILRSMKEGFKIPEKSEGFDDIILVNTWQ